VIPTASLSDGLPLEKEYEVDLDGKKKKKDNQEQTGTLLMRVASLI
jgi:hypothetical protein